ncbi:hypothetical protein [Clostridioides difficile]|nr:hypothetical protein [Clostridioides difficile]
MNEEKKRYFSINIDLFYIKLKDVFKEIFIKSIFENILKIE